VQNDRENAVRNAYASNAAVEAGSRTKAYEYRRLRGDAIQYVGEDLATGLPVDSAGLTGILDAAAWLGVEPKALRGRILRAAIHDPIGDLDAVYPWSLPRAQP
jgi:hypothetical protein